MTSISAWHQIGQCSEAGFNQAYTLRQSFLQGCAREVYWNSQFTLYRAVSPNIWGSSCSSIIISQSTEKHCLLKAMRTVL